MYCNFYSLKERPFNPTADPAFLFLSARHKEALAHLIYGVSQRKGVVVLTGEIGTGKTTLCRFFMNQLDRNVKTAFILNPHFSQTQLLEAIIRDFGLTARNKSRLGLVWELNRFLLGESECGNNVVLLIDEAQNLNPAILEQVRLLSNLETDKDKLLQLVLVGQPELNQRLNLYDLRQLKQRVMVSYHIMPLEKNEVKDYIAHRLKIAGGSCNVEFTPEAIAAISGFSAGTPRLINMICDRALLAGFAAETKIISPDIIKKCANELSGFFWQEAR